MNDILKLIHERKSIRKFTGEHIPEDDLTKIISAAKSVPNFNNYQPSTFIEISDQKIKEQAAEISGMAHVATSDRFFVITADYNKMLIGLNEEERATAIENMGAYNYLEGAAISAGIAAYAAILAANSLGYGGVTMAGPVKAFEIYEKYLHLPKMVKVIFTLALGVPANDPGVKPKLPLSVFWQKDAYDQKKIEAGVAEYNKTMRAYYKDRGIDDDWTSHNKKRIAVPFDSTALTKYAHDKGFALK